MKYVGRRNYPSGSWGTEKILGSLEVIVGISTFPETLILMQQTSGYQYTSQAKPINARGAYRNPDQAYETLFLIPIQFIFPSSINSSGAQRGYGNMMYDRRIRRGNTFSIQMHHEVCSF